MPISKNQNQINYCDHGHETTEEVRMLQIGSGANLIVCQKHFRKEIKGRKSYNIIHPKAWSKEFTDVEWENLKIYNPEE